MKNLLFLSLMLFAVAGCNQKTNSTETDQTEVETTEAVSTTVDTTENAGTALAQYACPMHPEVKGNKGAACSKCGMELTEPVK